MEALDSVDGSRVWGLTRAADRPLQRRRASAAEEHRSGQPPRPRPRWTLQPRASGQARAHSND